MSGPGFFRKPFPITARKVKKKIPQLSTLASYYTHSFNRLKHMAAIDAQVISYMRPEKKRRLKNQFKYTQSLYQAQNALNYNPSHSEKLLDCAYLLRQMNNSGPLSFEQNKTPYRDQEACSPWNFVQVMDSFINTFPKNSVDFITEIRDGIIWVNGQRLYWVWGGCLISSFMGIVNIQGLGNLKYYQSNYSYGVSFVSFYFYFARFFLEFYLLMRNVFGPWIEEEAEFHKGSTWFERLSYYGNARKYLLINDFFWSIANCLCAVLLIGQEFLKKGSSISFSDLGNYLTTLLLLLDVVMAVIALKEGKEEYKTQQTAFILELKQLKEKRERLYLRIEAHEKNFLEKKMDRTLLESLYGKLRQLNTEIREQERLIEYAEFEWKYKQYTLEIGLGYACLLLFAFILVCSVLTPAASVPMLFANSFFLIGSLLSFGLNVGAEILTRYFAAEKAKKEIAHLEKEGCDLVKQFNRIFQGLAIKKDYDPRLIKMELAYLYLEIAALYTEKVNKEKKLPYQQGLAAIKSVAQAVLPGLLLLSFSTLTAGYAILLVLSVITLLLLIYLSIKHLEPIWVCKQMNALQALQDQRKELTLDHFDKYLVQPENNFFQNVWDDFRKTMEALAPKWLFFVMPPLTLTLLVFGLIYFCIKKCQNQASSEPKTIEENLPGINWIEEDQVLQIPVLDLEVLDQSPCLTF